MEWRVRLIRIAIDCFAKNEKTPAEFFKDFVKSDQLHHNKIPSLTKIKENYGLSCEGRVLSKYILHNLHKRSMESHFLTLSLNRAKELIWLKFSGKIDYSLALSPMKDLYHVRFRYIIKQDKSFMY